VPKIDKDYSLYRTYVIFRTLGLRHLVVVDVHNHVVGLITRKDLMPFKMQERLESLLDQTAILSPDLEFGFNNDEQKKSVDSGKGSSYSDKPPRLSTDTISNNSVDVSISAIVKTSSETKISYEKEEEGEVQSNAPTGSFGDDCDSVSETRSQIVVFVSPPDDDASERQQENENHSTTSTSLADDDVPGQDTSPPNDHALELQPATSTADEADEDDSDQESDTSSHIEGRISPLDDDTSDREIPS